MDTRARRAGSRSIGVCAFVAVLGSFGCTEAPPLRNPALEVSLEGLDPELADLIRARIVGIESNPDDSRAHGLLGLAFDANLMYERSWQCYDHAFLLEPSALWLYRAARARATSGDVDGALALLEAPREGLAAFAPLSYLLGDLLLQSGELERAREPLEECVVLAPDRCEAYFGRAKARFASGEIAAAAADLERAIELDDGYRAAHYLLGRVYGRLGRAEEAKQALERGSGGAERALPDELSDRERIESAGRMNRLAQARELLAAGRFEDLSIIADRVLAYHPRDAEALSYKARAAITLGRPEAAFAPLDAILAQSPDRLDALRMKVVACSELGRNTEALAVLQKLVALTPQDALVHVNLSACYLELGTPTSALEHADAAITLAPASALAHLTHARAADAVGDRAGSERSLEEAARLGTPPKEIEALRRKMGH